MDDGSDKGSQEEGVCSELTPRRLGLYNVGWGMILEVDCIAKFRDAFG